LTGFKDLGNMQAACRTLYFNIETSYTTIASHLATIEFQPYYWEAIRLLKAQQAVSLASEQGLDIGSPKGKQWILNAVWVDYNRLPVVTREDTEKMKYNQSNIYGDDLLHACLKYHENTAPKTAFPLLPCDRLMKALYNVTYIDTILGIHAGHESISQSPLFIDEKRAVAVAYSDRQLAFMDEVMVDLTDDENLVAGYLIAAKCEEKFKGDEYTLKAVSFAVERLWKKLSEPLSEDAE
jgi:hypothetical protein